jgi:hypothetical protein
MAGWLTWKAQTRKSSQQKARRAAALSACCARCTHRRQVQLLLWALRADLQQVVAQDFGGALEHRRRGRHFSHQRLKGEASIKCTAISLQAGPLKQPSSPRRAALSRAASRRAACVRIGARRAVGRHSPLPCRRSVRPGRGRGRPPWARRWQSRCPPGCCTRPPWRRPRASTCRAARSSEPAARPEAQAQGTREQRARQQRAPRPRREPWRSRRAGGAPAGQPCWWHASRWAERHGVMSRPSRAVCAQNATARRMMRAATAIREIGGESSGIGLHVTRRIVRVWSFRCLRARHRVRCVCGSFAAERWVCLAAGVRRSQPCSAVRR